MGSLILALDTCLAACSAALVRDGVLLAAASEPMSRGHQERLAPMVRDLMAQAGRPFSELDRIGVTVGPGSFTGLRVGLAFAKGLGLALGRPCVGVGTLEALAASVDIAGPIAAVIDAGRGRVFLQIFENGQALCAPDSLELALALARIAEVSASGPVTFVGPAAALLGGAGATIVELAAPSAAAVARLAEAAPLIPPRPLYLRAPDATPKGP